MDKLFESFIETLNLLLLPKMLKRVSYLSIVNENLAELEGDYYTFFQEDNVKKLVEKGYICLEAVELVKNIRNSILRLDPTLWNAIDFIESEEWQNIRKLAVEFFKKELIKTK